MKKLLIKTALLALPFAVVLAFVEYELRCLPTSYSTTRAELESRLDRIEVVFTGTSHEQSGIRADLLGAEAFNLAQGSQSLHYDTQLVSKYAPRMPRLRLVIFGVSYHSLEYKLGNSIERWRGGFYQQVYGVAPEGFGERVQLSNYSYVALYTPKEAYRRVLARLRGGGAGGDAHGGAAATAAAPPGEVSAEFGRRRVRLHESEMYRHDLEPNREALTRACRELRSRGVAVAFLTMPVHRTYAEHIRPDTYRRMQDTIRRIGGECGAEYFDYLADPRFADAADFSDSDHLSARGAEKFSRILAGEVVGKYVRRAGGT